MEQYKIRADGFNEIRKQLLIRTIPLMLIALTIGFGITEFNPNRPHDINVWPFVIPFVLATAGTGVYLGIKRQKKLYESYTLTITENTIIREQINTTAIQIAFSDIKDIIKSSNGSFAIKGKATLDVIGVPSQIENPAQLESTLNKIKPLAAVSGIPIWQKYQLVLVLTVCLLMATVNLATNKIIVAVSGTIVSATLIWSVIQTQRSKNIDLRTKLLSWIVVPVLISIIVTMFSKLLAD